VIPAGAVLRGVAARAVLLTVGTAAGLALAEAALSLAAAARYERVRSVQARRAGKSGYRVLCIGRSTGLGGPGGRLESVLHAHFPGGDFDFVDLRMRGTSGRRVALRIRDSIRRFDPDAVVVLLGETDRGVEPATRPAGTRELLRRWRTVRLAERSAWAGGPIDPLPDAEEWMLAHTESALRRATLGSHTRLFEREYARVAARLGRFPDDERLNWRLSVLEDLRGGAAFEGFGSIRRWNRRRRRELSREPLMSGAIMGEVLGTAGEMRRFGPRSLRPFLARWREGDLEGAIGDLERVLLSESSSARLWGLLGMMRLSAGREAEAEAGFLEAESRRRRETSADLWNAYALVKNAVLEEGRVLVCVQYPARRVEPLERMVGPQRGVYFVDNGPSFRRAVRERGVWTMFEDLFAGDFGHLTDEGADLLAENVARVFEREIWTVDGARRPPES
jgi:hypothetical protein